MEQNADRKTIWVFTPSRTDPKDLEFILVQRQKLLQDAVERVRESALTKHKHHLLFVGPRGCGKTHLVTLIVSRLGNDDELTNRLRIAWLNEDETCTTLLEFFLKVHQALEKRYPSEYSAETLAPAYEMKPDAALEFVSRQLLDSLGSRTLLILTENLDSIFEGLGDAGQKQLRAFIQENPRLSIVATAQRLVEDLSDRASPFFGFFQTEHLKPLNFEEATELLQNIARLNGNGELVEFLSTSRGRSRVRALHHLSGGNHRIYIVLSQFITRDSIDALLGPFMKMVDELTPYYQERLRWLPPMQRKIVEYLCVCEGTVPVKEIAKRLFATPQTVSSQLQDLREKGYIEANQRGRESLYEISEPLMRICVEVKENQSHQPLRLLVDFLRAWYDEKQLNFHLGKLDPSSSSRAYLESALQRNSTEGNLRKRLFLDELQVSLPEEMPSAMRNKLLRECENLPEPGVLAIGHWVSGEIREAIKCLNDEAIAEESDPASKAACLLLRGQLQSAHGNSKSAINDYTTTITLAGAPAKQVAMALVNRGITHHEAGDTQHAIEDYTAVINLADAPVVQVTLALVNRGVAHGNAGDTQHEIEDYTAAINLARAPVKQVAMALINRGVTHGNAGSTQHEIEDYTAVINLARAPVEQVAMALVNRGVTHGEAGNTQHAIEDYTAVINLANAPVVQVTSALFNRGITHGGAGDTQHEIEDYTAAINLADAPVKQVAMALINRGVTHGNAGDTRHAIEDFTTVINLADAPVVQVACALFNRGVTFYQLNQRQKSQSDLEALLHLADAPATDVVNAYLALTEIHWSDGRWSEGFEALENGLRRGAKEKSPYYSTATDIVGVLFSAGLSPEGRSAKVAELLGLYARHSALPVLGQGVVEHIGRVFTKGEPWPSADNLEQWASAWEQAAGTTAEFRLPIRLLRTGVNFIEAGGKDPGILMDLSSPERSILRQALGLDEKEPV